MKLEKIKLTNFRNLHEIEITTNPRLNLIFGPNGSGKTNFCEAIYFASTGNNLKGIRQRELIKWDSKYTLIKLNTVNEDVVVVYLETEDGKEIKVNSKNARQSDLRSLIPTHIFVPGDLYIPKGPPQKRRDMLNRQLGLLSADYGKRLSEYQSELKKKNTLLKKDKINEEFLSILNERLVDLGAQISLNRANYLQRLNERLPEIYGLFGHPEEKLSLNYAEDISPESSKEELKALLADRLEENREREMEQETSVVGPHRDKFEYRLNGKNLRKFGSQGELRTAVISTYLAYLNLYEENFEEWPILILDDILSELDRGRGESFLENLPEGPQIFMTTATRDSAFKKLSGEFSVLEINGGNILQK